MDKLKKQILFVLLISILLCSVQAIAAADVSDTGVNDDVFDLSNDIETVEADSNDEVLDAPSSDEILEAPGTFTQLQNAINSAGNSYTLTNNYTKGSSEDAITISKAFTLDGAGYTLDGNFVNNFRYEHGIIDVGGYTTITLKNIHFKNSIGSAIDVGTYRLNIINCTFENCNATVGSETHGGAIYVNYGNVTVDGCTFTDNYAQTGSAIYLSSWGTLSVSNSKIIDNQASSNSITLTKDSNSGTFHKYIVTFTGNDNLLNGIYSEGTISSLKNVTYWNQNGEVTNNPSTRTDNHEAGITINLIIKKGNTVIMNVTQKTNASGVALFTNETLIDFLHLEEGDYQAQAIHYADSYYTYIASRVDDFHCARANHGTNVSDVTVEGYAGQTIDVISFNVTRTGQPDPVQNGTINVTINGQVYTGNVVNGVANITNVVLPDASGEYTVYYNNKTTKYYWASNGTLTINILAPGETSVTVTPENIYVGETEHIAFTVGPDGVTGTVTIVIVNATSGAEIQKYESVAIADGSPINVTGLAAGDYNVTVTFPGDSYYSASNATATFTVSKNESTVSVTPKDITFGEDEPIVFTVTEGASGNVIITIDGGDLTEPIVKEVAVSGSPISVSGLSAGTYTVTISYDGDDNFTAAETVSKDFTVAKKASEVSVTPKDIKVGDDETITFNVTEGATGTVKIVIVDAEGAEVYNETVAVDGSPISKSDLPAGTYTVTISYGGDGNFTAAEDATNEFTVSKRNVIVTINPEPVTGEQGTTATVTITVTEEDGVTPVTGGTVVYTINWEDKLGETHSITLGATLDENGQATQEVELSGEPGTYSATASYTDDSGKYNDGEAEGTAVVTESESDDNSTDDTPDDPTDDSDDSDDSTDDSSEETQETASKSAAVETLATGNPIAMLLLVLLTLVSTISIRRQK